MIGKVKELEYKRELILSQIKASPLHKLRTNAQLRARLIEIEKEITHEYYKRDSEIARCSPKNK
jgi:hypothetical protein